MYFCEYEKSLLECNKIKIAAYISVVDNNNELGLIIYFNDFFFKKNDN